MLIALVVGTASSCAISRAIQKTPEEIGFAQEAVQEILLMSLEGASERAFPRYATQTLANYFLPAEAYPMMLHLDRIPGAERLLGKYLAAMSVAANSVMKEMGPVLKPILLGMLIPEPFTIIEGGSNAATTFFIREQGDLLRLKIQEKLSLAMAGSEGSSGANKAWRDLQILYNTFATAQNQAKLTALPLLDIDPLAWSALSLWNIFTSGMAAQEDLIRATAASFESAAIALFIIEERD